MYFTFSEEASYGLDATSQDYVLDLVEEEIVTNVNYLKMRQFNYPTVQTRYPQIKTAKGRIKLELTYGNLGWNILFKSLMGQRITLADFKLAQSSERWNVITGILSAEINDSQTTFTITEYKVGEFDNVAGVIVGNEYIAVGAVSNGAVTVSTRASEGTTAVLHEQNTLVYGVVVDVGKNLDILSRYRSGFCYSLPTSLTAMIYRSGDYFAFNGALFSDFVFNAIPATNSLNISLALFGRNSRVINISSPSSATDDNGLVVPQHLSCYSMNEWLDIDRLYFQISNTLLQSSSKMFDTTYLGMNLSTISTYGQFTLVEENLDAYNVYLQDNLKNLSLVACDSKNFENAYVFAFNSTRYGTLLHMLRGGFDITDSVPFFCFGPEKFAILIQT